MRIREVWENLFFGEIKRYRQEMTYQKKRSNAPPVTRRRPVFNKEGLCSLPASYRFLVLWVVFLLPTFQVNTRFLLFFSFHSKKKDFTFFSDCSDCSSIRAQETTFHDLFQLNLDSLSFHLRISSSLNTNQYIYQHIVFNSPLCLIEELYCCSIEHNSPIELPLKEED